MTDTIGREVSLEAVLKGALAASSWVTIYNQGISDLGAEKLADALELYAGLRVLHLRGTAIGDQGIALIAPVLKQHLGLRKLDLGDNKIGAKGGAKLSEALSQLAELQLLHLGKNNLGDKGTEAIVKALRPTREQPRELLEELNLGSNGITDKCLKEVGQTARLVVCLKVLWLDANKIGDAGVLHLAKALQSGSGLRTVHLEKNRIGDNGTAKLAEALDVSPSMRDLHLDGNRLGNEGAKRLAKTLAKCTPLRVLSLEGCSITDVGAFDLVACLSRRPPEQTVNCSIVGNPVLQFGEETLDDLSRAALTVRHLATVGITLGQILDFYDTNYAQGLIIPYETTTSDAILKLLIPQTKDYQLSYAVCKGHGNPLPTVFVIHAWKGLFHELVNAIAQDATGMPYPNLDPDADYWDRNQDAYNKSYFLSPFCVNQHENNPYAGTAKDENGRLILHETWDEKPIPQHPIGDPRCETDKMHLVTEEIKHRGGTALVALDGDFLALGRLRCLSELRQAMAADMELQVALGKVRKISRGVRGHRVQDAEADPAADKPSLLGVFEQSRGGCDKFNADVLALLEQKAVDKYYEMAGCMPAEDLTPNSSAVSESECLELRYVMHKGRIEGDDLLVETMTIEEAKDRSAEIEGCEGFSFEGEETEEPVEIHFKDCFELVEDEDWTSFHLEEVMPLKFSTRPGRLDGDDLLVETMTVEDAKERVADLDGCEGFTFEGELTEEPVEIFFKNSRDVAEDDEGWYSFLVETAPEATFEMQYGVFAEGGILLTETMTPDDAKTKAAELEWCQGFTFESSGSSLLPETEPVEVQFTNCWQPVEKQGWAACRVVRAPAEEDIPELSLPAKHATFEMHEGSRIAAKEDILVETLASLEEAKERAEGLENCQGFTFESSFKEGPVAVYFKSQWQLVGDEGWTSCRVDAAKFWAQAALDQLSAAEQA